MYVGRGLSATWPFQEPGGGYRALLGDTHYSVILSTHVVHIRIDLCYSGILKAYSYRHLCVAIVVTRPDRYLQERIWYDNCQGICAR